MTIPDFVDREDLLKKLIYYCQVPPAKKKFLLLDSPAGMGKTYAIIELCLELASRAHIRSGQSRWKFVRLDFRESSTRCDSQAAVLEEIARQWVSDQLWDAIRAQLRQADLPSKKIQSLLLQVATMPFSSKVRQDFLHAVGEIRPEYIATIQPLLVQTFDNVDIQELLDDPLFTSLSSQTAALGKFLNNKKRSSPSLIPDNTLLILDSLDAIESNAMRDWIMQEMVTDLSDSLDGKIGHVFILLAGRFVAQHIPLKLRESQYVIHELDPLLKRDVETLISLYEDQDSPLEAHLISRLARKLTWASSGHPRLIRDVAERLYQEQESFSLLVHDPQRRLYWYSTQKEYFWDDNTKKCSIPQRLLEERASAISEILDGIEEEEAEALRLLSVFRNFNSATLEYLMLKIQSAGSISWPHFNKSADELFSSLENRRLVGTSPVTSFFSGHIVSGLMAIQMLHMKGKEPERYRLLNQFAGDLFADWMVGRYLYDPDNLRPTAGDYQRVCLCDWLYHSLCVLKCSIKASAAVLPLLEEIETIADEMESMLENIAPLPGMSQKRLIGKIAESVEEDDLIDHLLWELASEDPVHYPILRNKIIDPFKIYLREA
ncbi:MAG: hypothetical protein JW726_00980 [Anaerolineales bacterium]|nr:hypothetical protein [Anaerolineales bacterium]